MNSGEKLAYLFGFMDAWEEMSVHLLRKPFNIVQSKKTFTIEHAIPLLAPKWSEAQVFEFFTECKKADTKKIISDILLQKYQLDKMLDSIQHKGLDWMSGMRLN